jgi:hypothetical protein
MFILEEPNEPTLIYGDFGNANPSTFQLHLNYPWSHRAYFNMFNMSCHHLVCALHYAMC